jgi:hypothetical protein
MPSDATSGEEGFILEGIGTVLFVISCDDVRRTRGTSSPAASSPIRWHRGFAESAATTWQTARDAAYFWSGGVPYL